MRKNRLFWVIAAAAPVVASMGIATPAQAQSTGQPYASYWHPNDLLTWDPTTDPDAAFNRSNVALADRFINPALNVNSNTVLSTGVTALAAFGTTSNNPSQGSQSMRTYAPTYWQYMDTMVYWGGSASEGIILAPKAPVIDAAHRNGVKVLGNVFLPPVAYGGQVQWVRDFLQQDTSGNFLVADKMILAAKTYGFDGWFLNQETAGVDSNTAVKMQQFINYVHSKSNLTIQWYDSMTSSSQIYYQNALNSNNQMFFENSGQTGTGGKVADSMFLNFNWTAQGLTDSHNLADSLGRNPTTDLVAGIDVEANGYNKYVDWNAVFPAGQAPKTNIAFYRPEWTYNSSSSNADFYARESKFWVGANADPSNTSSPVAGTSNWQGVANYVNAQSVVNQTPFVTNFNTGQGNRYAINGQVLATGEWNNLSLQDVLPTWRWLMASTGAKLTPELNWDDAYYGGTCLKVSGSTSAVNDLKLYETNMPVAANTNLRIAFKNGQANSASLMQVGLAFTADPTAFTFLNVGSTTSADWNTKILSLGQFAGATIAAISLRFGDGTVLNNYSMNVGQLAFYNGTPSTPAAATGLYVDGGVAAGQLRTHWTHSTDSATNLYYYNLYRRNPDNSLSWLGATPNNAYYVPSLTRYGNENFVNLELETLGLDFGTSATRATSTVYVDWDRSAWTLNWQGNGSSNGGSGTWNVTNNNWNSGPTAPANQFWSNRQNDHAVFGGTAGTVTLGAAVSANSLEFQSNGYTLTGSNALTMAGTTPTITVANAAHNATLSAAIAGTAGLTKSGAGKLTLTAANTYTGNTLVSGGTLQLGDGTAGHDGSIVGNITNNASLAYHLSGTQTLNSVVSGSGSLTKSGGGTLAVSKAQTYTGATVISGGTLKLTAPLTGPAAPVAGYARWFDASNPANLTLNGSTITQWNDLSGNGANATNATGTRQPTYVSNAVNGLGAVHLTGTGANDAGQYLLFNEDASIKSVFVIFKGNSFLLTDTSTYNFHRSSDTDPTAPLWDSVNAAAAIRNGSTYVNGTLVNGTTSAMPTNLNNGFNLVEMLTNGTSVAANGFNRDRVFHNGDQYQAEVLIYDTVLTEAQRLQNEQYLNYKWFGIGSIGDPSSSGNFLPAGTALTISNGSTLDLNGLAQTIGSLSSTDGLGSRVLLGGGTLTTGDATHTTFDGVISGTGSLIKQGSGIMTLSATNTYSGSTFINGGTLLATKLTAISGYNTPGKIIVGAGATLGARIGDGSTGLTLAQIDSLRANATWTNNTSALGFDTTNGDFSYDRVLSGNISLAKLGANTLTLTAANTYTGNTLINGGTLQINDGGSLGSGSVIDNANLTFNRSGSLTFDKAISGTGTLTKNGAGTLALAGNNTYTGATAINSGILQVNSANALGSTGDIAFNGGTLQYTANNTTDYSARLKNSTAAIVLDTNSQNVNFNTALDSSNAVKSLVKNGAGQLIFGNGAPGNLAAQSLTSLTINGGLARTDFWNTVNPNLALTINTGGTFEMWDASQTLSTLSGNGTLQSTAGYGWARGGVTLTVGNGDQSSTFSGTLTDGGGTITAMGLTKIGTGTQTLAGNNTYTGDTQVRSGTLSVTGSLGNTAVTVDSGATLRGTGTIAGATTVNGTLTVGTSHGTSGAASTLTFGHNLSLTGMTNLDLFSASSADKIIASSIAMGGTLNVANAGGFTFAAGQSWDLFDGTFTGSFTNVLPDVTAQHLKWNTSKLTSTGELSITAAASASLSNTNPGGTITAETAPITGSDGDYQLGNAHLTTAAEKGLVHIASTNGIDAPTYVLLDLLDASKAADVVNALGSMATTDRSIMSRYEYTNIHYDVMLTFNQASAVSTYFSFDLTGIASVQNVGVVPEPGSLSLLTIGALGLLSRRRRKVTSGA